MKKRRFAFLVLCLLMQNAFAQISTITGTVKNEDGQPIAAALVSEFKTASSNATYTDTIGFFSLQVRLYSKLSISSKGYNDTLVNAVDKKSIVIILSKVKNARHHNEIDNSTNEQILNSDLLQDAAQTQTGVHNNFVYHGAVTNYTGVLMPVFTHKEETMGSRYAFNNWVHGFVTDTNNFVFNNPAYWYNYDKIGGGLLLTQDRQSAIEADRNNVQSFTIHADADNPVVYYNIPAIDNSHFVQVISTGDKYKICKLTRTKFVKSDYHTDGVTSSGNDYDEYVDESSYFVLDVKSNQIQKISLKKKSIKEAFPLEADKLNKFFSDSNSDKIDDIFLKNLGDFLNK